MYTSPRMYAVKKTKLTLFSQRLMTEKSGCCLMNQNCKVDRIFFPGTLFLCRFVCRFSCTFSVPREPFPPHADLDRLRRGLVSAGRSLCEEEGFCGNWGEGQGSRSREAVKHYLARLGLLQLPKVHRLFHASVVDSKCLKADSTMR